MTVNYAYHTPFYTASLFILEYIDVRIRYIQKKYVSMYIAYHFHDKKNMCIGYMYDLYFLGLLPEIASGFRFLYGPTARHFVSFTYIMQNKILYLPFSIYAEKILLVFLYLQNIILCMNKKKRHFIYNFKAELPTVSF